MTVTVTLSFDNVDQLVDFFRTTPAAPKIVPDARVVDDFLRRQMEAIEPPATTGLDSRDEVNAQLAAAGIEPRFDPELVREDEGPSEVMEPKTPAPKPKRGRPRKENAAPASDSAGTAASTAVTAPAAAPSPAPTAKTYTNVEALDVFKKVKEVRGIQACFDLLARYGAGGGFRDVKPEQYPKFVADCEAVIAGKDIAAAE